MYGQFFRNDDSYTWLGNSGSSIQGVQYVPVQSGIDLSIVTCSYCGSEYLAELVRSKQITNCLGCGSARFYFKKG